MYGHGSGVEQNLELAVFWLQKAVEQGYVPAYVNLGMMYEHGSGVEENKKFAARLYRQAAEQQENNAIIILKDSTKPPVMVFHYAMLSGYKEHSLELINKEPKLIDELIWDLQRNMEDMPSYLHSVIQTLVQNYPWPEHLQNNLNQLAIAYLLKIHEQQISFPETKYQECFYNVLPLLGYIDYSSLDAKIAHAMIHFNIDAWNLSEMDNELESRLQFTEQISEILQKLLVRLQFIERPLNDPGLLLQIALVFVRKIYGSGFETTFNELDTKQLSCFLFYSERKPVLSYQQMNALLGTELIKPAINYVELLNQLSAVLSSEDLLNKPTFLSQLNTYIQKNWNELDTKNERIAKSFLIELSNKTKLFLVCSEKHQNLFFKGEGNRSIVKFLADKNFNSLMMRLRKESELDEPHERTAHLSIC
jgi:hypothetical protein